MFLAIALFLVLFLGSLATVALCQRITASLEWENRITAENLHRLPLRAVDFGDQPTIELGEDFEEEDTKPSFRPIPRTPDMYRLRPESRWN